MIKDAGQLRHRVRIESLSDTLNDDGIRVVAWVPFRTVWASVVPASGREFLAANAVQAATMTKITIRHLDGITQSMRIVHNSSVYNITAMLPDPTFARHIVLMCEAGVQ
jgi:SPP1 family predicted phage head-tail adaptor